MNPIPWSFLDDYQSFPSLFMYKIAQMTYEVAIIGSGLVGSAIAYDLKNLGVRTIILESESDLGAGASRSNSGVLHTGFDSKPNTLETQLIRKQAERWPDIFAKLEIPYKKTGAVLLAKNSDEEAGLETIQKDALANGVKTNILSRQEIQKLEPNAVAQAALLIPEESITDPYEVIRRLLWDTDIKLNSKVTALEPLGETINIITTQGIIKARYVINCAGLFADEFTQEFQITPRRGEFIAFEKGSTNLIKHILLPMPNEFTKGVLVFPTLHGYLCAGPSAEDQEDKTDWTPHKNVLPILHQKASEMVPALETMQSVSAWAGLRTVGHPHNYLIEYSKQIPQLLHVAGIRSTGLSACLGISDYVIKMIKDRGLRETSAAIFSKPVFSDSQPWWERLNTLRKVDVKHVLNEGRKEEGGKRKG